ncbi:hypothetical protein F4778DRAFT_777321 [Xylariomycetidae sp. FL2044]|nr:hypothetical protein F4778DRAFT_777321 [Xylariomycetidae sp. FL2044]
MNPTDEELDRNWQPNGRRPQSTIARSFSQELMDIFKIENSIADLDEKVDKRKQQVTTGQSELEALEARIKEMEARLKKTAPGISQGSSPRATRQALGHTFDEQKHAAATGKQPMQLSRPGTAKQSQNAPAHGGAMPPTPTASEGEYDHVKNILSSSTGGDDHGAETRSFTDYVIVSKDGGDRDP